MNYRPSLAQTVGLSPQARVVLLHLERQKSINPVDASMHMGIFRLSARVHELRSIGYQIVTDREGNGTSKIAKYRLAS